MSPEENKTLVRRWFAETDKGNLAIVEELCARTTSTTARRCRGCRGDAGVGTLTRRWAAFPDTVHIVEDQIAEGDKVVTRLRARATFTGEITGISIHRIADGKLVEHWANADLFGLMQQMGALPAPAEATG